MTNVEGRNSIDFTKYGLKGKQAGIDRKFHGNLLAKGGGKYIFIVP
jgi:hypothetical protein